MIASVSPVNRSPRLRRSAKVGRRRRSFALALATGIAALLAIGPAPSLADHVPRVCTSNQQQGTLCVTVTDKPDPVSYSDFAGNETFIFYRTLVTNASRSSSLSHVGLTLGLPAGTEFFRATTTRGTCSPSSQSVSCSIGQLKKGQGATVDLVVRAPATLDPDPVDQLVTLTATASFDERFNDQTGGKQDTATYLEPTTVSKDAGQTFGPQGHSFKVGTDPGHAQHASDTVPTPSVDLLATIEVLPPDDFCGDDGRVEIGNHFYICRFGGWVQDLVVNANTGALYSNAQNPQVKHLRWDGTLTSSRQTVKNFVIFDQATSTSPIQVIDTRCNATASNAPCIRNITPLDDGGISADYVRADDRRMR